METKETSLADAEKPIKIFDGEFGIKNGGQIEIIPELTKLVFEKGKDSDNNDVVVMHLSLTFNKDDYNIAIGPKEVDFLKLGAFKFNEKSFFNGSFEKLRVFIDSSLAGLTKDDIKTDGVKLVSSSRDFDITTTADKREHGNAIAIKTRI